MNFIKAMQLGCLLATPMLTFQCTEKQEVTPKASVSSTANARTASQSMTIAQLRSLNTATLPPSVYISDPGQEGTYNLVSGDRTSADNTGIILVTANGARYRRSFTGTTFASWFGVLEKDDDVGPELQAAVNSSNDVFIPDGSYVQKTSVVLKSNLKLRANPGKATLHLPQGSVSLVSGRPSVPLQNVVIDGLSWTYSSTKAGTDYSRVHIDGPSVENFTVQNCTSSDPNAVTKSNWMTIKIQVGKTANNIVVRKNNIQSGRMAVEIFNHDNYNVYAGKNIVVSENNLHDCWFGISLSGPLQYLTVDRNYIKNCSLFGIEIAGAARDTKITNNQFEGKFDKFLEGSNDGNGNGTVTGGMVVTGNKTVGTVTGGIQFFNIGAATFTNNNFSMTGMMELISPSCKGGTYRYNTIETTAPKAIICDNAPDNLFKNNTISNKNCSGNSATFVAYGAKAANTQLIDNSLIKGNGGAYYAAWGGASLKVGGNKNELGNLITALP